jgi:hypothetical protein
VGNYRVRQENRAGWLRGLVTHQVRPAGSLSLKRGSFVSRILLHLLPDNDWLNKAETGYPETQARGLKTCPKKKTRMKRVF